MTENAAELQLKEEKWQEPFLSFSLYGLSWRLSVRLYVRVCVRERERRRILDRQKASRRKPLGSNKSGLHWTEESWRILRGKTGVHSILGQRLGSDTSLILYNTRTHTHTHTDKAEITHTHFLLLYLITMSRHSLHIWFSLKCEILLWSNTENKKQWKTLLQFNWLFQRLLSFTVFLIRFVKRQSLTPQHTAVVIFPTWA